MIFVQCERYDGQIRAAVSPRIPAQFHGTIHGGASSMTLLVAFLIGTSRKTVSYEIHLSSKDEDQLISPSPPTLFHATLTSCSVKKWSVLWPYSNVVKGCGPRAVNPKKTMVARCYVNRKWAWYSWRRFVGCHHCAGDIAWTELNKLMNLYHGLTEKWQKHRRKHCRSIRFCLDLLRPLKIFHVANCRLRCLKCESCASKRKTKQIPKWFGPNISVQTRWPCGLASRILHSTNHQNSS